MYILIVKYNCVDELGKPDLQISLNLLRNGFTFNLIKFNVLCDLKKYVEIKMDPTI